MKERKTPVKVPNVKMNEAMIVPIGMRIFGLAIIECSEYMLGVLLFLLMLSVIISSFWDILQCFDAKAID